jgi:hypothetical protein
MLLRWEIQLSICSERWEGMIKQRLDPSGVLWRCRIVDDHAEVGPPIDGKGRIFERDGAENRVSNVLDGLARRCGSARR